MNNKIKIILAVLLLVGVFTAIKLQSLSRTAIDDDTPELGIGFPVLETPTIIVPNEDPRLIPERNAIASISSSTTYSAEGYLRSSDTIMLTEGFYKNTTMPDVYAIYYLETHGRIMIDLFDEDLRQSRLIAEQQLKALLPYTEDEFCSMDIRVGTNEYVSRTYASLELRLSFCPFSRSL